MMMMERRFVAAVFVLALARLPAATPDATSTRTAAGSPGVACTARGWQIDARPRLLLSAEFDYARLPRGVWQERMQLARSAGFNALTIPVYWSFHESRPGRFDFAGRRDLARVLDRCRREGMWAIVRVGPWVGGDWELGGVPPWVLAQTPRLRQRNPEFLSAAERWFEVLMPLLAERQVHRGGAVIGVEMEQVHRSEDRQFDPGYFEHFRKRAQSLGIEVPIIPSANETNTGRPDSPRIGGDRQPPGRRAIVPLGKARAWGESDVVRDRSADVATQIARGARWIDCRHFLGGTNFGFQAAEGVPARYDCGAPVGETGEVRSTYYALKKWLLWAQSAEPILTGAESEATTVGLRAGRPIQAFRYRSVGGELRLLYNRGHFLRSVTIAAGGTSPTTERIDLPPRSVWPIVRDWRLSASMTVERCAAPLYHAGRIGGRRLLIAAVRPDEIRTIVFRTGEALESDLPRACFTPTETGCILRVSCGPDGTPRDYRFTAGERVQVVAVPEPLFARIWPLGEKDGKALVLGGDVVFASEVSVDGTPAEITVVDRSKCGELRLYGAAVPPSASSPATKPATTSTLPEGGKEDGYRIIRVPSPTTASVPSRISPPTSVLRWQQREDTREAKPKYDDHAWVQYPEPFTHERLVAESLGPPTQVVNHESNIQREPRAVSDPQSKIKTPRQAVSDPQSKIQNPKSKIDTPFIWYRTTLDVPRFSTYTLRTGGIGDRAVVFLEGMAICRLDGARTDECRLILPPGRYALATLVEQDGRTELRRAPRLVPENACKGLRPPAVLAPGGLRAPIPYWYFAVNDRGPDEAHKILASSSGEANWQVLMTPGPDDMNHHRGYAWYRTAIYTPEQGTLEIYLSGADDRAWVYLDRQLVGMHDDPRHGRLIRVPDTLRVRRGATQLTLSILVENRRGPGGLTGPVYIGMTQPHPTVRIGPWRMRAGLGGECEGWFRPDRLLADTTHWTEVTPPARSTIIRWYRTRFTYDNSLPSRPDLAASEIAQNAKTRVRPPAIQNPKSKIQNREALFLHLGSLQRGLIWLNGHSLGRYQNTGHDAQRGVYLPACWLQPLNWIVVAETAGGVPEGASIEAELADRYTLTTIQIGPK